MRRIKKYSFAAVAAFVALLSAMLLSSPWASAQNKVLVKGTVVDDQGEPVIGAYVVEKGTKNGTTTDANGMYELNIPHGWVTLQVSCLGLQSQEVAVQNKTTVDIYMAPDAQALEGTVVTALGIRRDEKALGYAVSSVGADALVAGREENVMSAIIGKVAGVDITTTSGGPSGSTSVTIRGNSQLSGSNRPLYVVDGVPMENDMVASEPGKFGGYDYGDVLQSINPGDIESISVLKGPSASALYGSSASNGVVMITTKSAAAGQRIGVELSSSVSMVSLLSHFQDYQRVYGQGRDGQLPMDINDANGIQYAWGAKLDPTAMAYVFTGDYVDYGNKSDNVLSFFKTGVTLNNSVAISKSTGTGSFRLSLSDMRLDDIMPKSGMTKTSVMMKASQRFGKKLTLDAQATYTVETTDNRPALGGLGNNVIHSLINLAPSLDQAWLADHYKDKDGNYIRTGSSSSTVYNPYWVINEMKNESERDRLVGKVSMTWKIRKDLTFYAKGGLDTFKRDISELTPISTPSYENGRIVQKHTDMTQTDFEARLTYAKKFDKLDVNSFVGANVRHHLNKTTNLEGLNHLLTDVIDITGFETRQVSRTVSEKEVRSLYGQLSLGWNDIYYLDATVRNDVSSSLAPKHRSYWYPSLSGSILASNMFEHGKWLTFAKLRGSWARVGGDTSPYQLSLDYALRDFTLNGKSLGTATGMSSIPYYDLKPTSTNSIEFGADLRFFDSRLTLDLTVYKQNTTDQIMNLPVSTATGRDKALINAGEIENKGVEVTLGITPVETRDFKWDITATYSHNQNMVKYLHPDVPNYELAAARWANAWIYALPGQPYGAIMGPTIKRNDAGEVIVDATTGLPKFNTELSVLGNGNYDHIVGLNTSMRYKNLSLTMVFDGKLGADLYSMTTMHAAQAGTLKMTLEGREEWYRSEQEREAQRLTSEQWTATGGYLVKGVVEVVDSEGNVTYEPNRKYVDPEDYWGCFRDFSPEPFILDASYVKLREMSLSYNLPRNWVKKVGLESVAVSLYGRNLAILYSKIKNIDPESSYSNGNGKGFEYGSLPSRRTFGFGVNLKF